jgi:hypothetical protein
VIPHVPLLKVGSGAWMAVPFALAAKLAGQRQPELACAALTSDRRKCLSMSMLERPVLHVDVVIEALGLDEHGMTSAHRLFSGQLIEARRRCPRLRVSSLVEARLRGQWAAAAFLPDAACLGRTSATTRLALAAHAGTQDSPLETGSVSGLRHE